MLKSSLYVISIKFRLAESGLANARPAKLWAPALTVTVRVENLDYSI